MIAKAALVAIAVSGVSLPGCASRCDSGQIKCQYECTRTYQLCQLRGNDEWYCHNQAGICWSDCQDNHARCKASWW